MFAGHSHSHVYGHTGRKLQNAQELVFTLSSVETVQLSSSGFRDDSPPNLCEADVDV